MMDTKVYHVARVLDEEYGWEIRAEGEIRARSLYQSRVEAFAAARRFARSHPDHRVLIHYPDGSVQPCTPVD